MKRLKFILVNLLIISCFKAKSFIVLTESELMPIIIKEFNSQSKLSFIVKYRKEINDDVLNSEDFDIVIAKNLLKKTKYNTHFKTINRDILLDYNLLNDLMRESNFKLIPLSFDVPILFFKKDFKIKETLTLDEISYYYKEASKIKKLFISPLFFDNLESIITLKELNFPDEESKEKLKVTLDSLKDLFESEREAHLYLWENYNYLKPQNILLNEKSKLIAFKTTLANFYKIANPMRGEFDFSFIISDSGKIPVENISYFASKNYTKSIAIFLDWILNAEGEKHLLEKTLRSRFFDNFGLFNGFSPYRELNLDLMPNAKIVPNIAQKNGLIFNFLSEKEIKSSISRKDEMNVYWFLKN